jgi:hypothetical protein
MWSVLLVSILGLNRGGLIARFRRFAIGLAREVIILIGSIFSDIGSSRVEEASFGVCGDFLTFLRLGNGS